MAQVLGYLEENALQNIANAIREKNGETGKYTPAQMPDKIRAISGGTDTSDATATSDDIVQGKTAYVNGSKVTGALNVVNCYHGSSEPSSSLGILGDLYIKTDSEMNFEDNVGSVSSANVISLSDELGSGTYTLYYEDDSNNKLEGWGEIATITK